jgi:hypothetical protein
MVVQEVLEVKGHRVRQDLMPTAVMDLLETQDPIVIQIHIVMVVMGQMEE